ncbi:Flp pilus assembly protein CpaB [Kocuria tytonicola]|uniref:Flp pilus assembly protein CpaB n=1 Tax=Kocuria tytonicola TaxID=2055946 RepID=A0A3L9L938_9MICC|nr:Flp pilus assembly protein CpaB [Kocuria tytonicola]RLY94459.1 Flp pilus assembly protein CpaB [Kocuria tytonicola]
MSSRLPRYPLGLRLRTAVRRRHRLVAAALCAVALTLVVLRLAPPGAQTTPVVTAARDVPAGRHLSAGDLVMTEFPADLVPGGAHTSLAEADGQTTTVALTAGQPVTPSTVLGPGVLAGQPSGTTAATVRVSDPAVLRHVRPGDAVDVVHHADDARSSPGRTAARGVTVLWAAAAPPEQGSSVLSGGGTDGDAGLVVLAAPRETATELASLEGSGRVSLVLVSR